MKFAYHCSIESGIKVLKPRKSTHGQSWVYATKHLAIAATFLGKWNDFDFALDKPQDKPPYLVERYKNAFEIVYSKSSGSIYKLPFEGFQEDMTSWSEEVVSTTAVSVLEEIKVSNAWEYLINLSKNDQIELFYYPERPSEIPKGETDLLEKAIIWINHDGKEVKEKFLKKHPYLEEKLNKMMKGVDIKDLRKKYGLNP